MDVLAFCGTVLFAFLAFYVIYGLMVENEYLKRESNLKDIENDHLYEVIQTLQEEAK